MRSSVLTDGSAKSCGCLARELARQRVTTHGMYDTFEYRVWVAMRKRCTYEKHPRYPRYGGRGICVCERWQEFANFLSDMGKCPIPNGSIERKDNNGNYTPDNCVWIPKTEQSKNRNCVKGTNMTQKNGKRDYKHAYALQKANGETKDQLERQKARRLYDKEGINRDGKHIDHITPLRKGGKTKPGNLRLRSPKANMGDNK